MHALKLVIQSIDNDGRLRLVPEFVRTPWRIEVTHRGDRSAFAQALHDADAFVSMSWGADFPAAPRLRLLQLPGAGTDAIDFACVPAQTAVCNTYEHEIGIAEYVMAGMLEWLIGLRSMDARFRQGDWTGSHLCGPHHGEMFGKTVGILGYGHIGREVAKRARAFGMHILACGRQARTGDEYCEQVAGSDALDDVLARSDFVVVAAPLNADTAGLINARRLALMKPTAVLINVARGGIVEEGALYRALESGSLGGAILDVWYHYPNQGERRGPPPSAYPFHELPNVIVTPHASGWSEGITARRNRVIAENLDRLARGEPFLNLVRAPRPQ